MIRQRKVHGTVRDGVIVPVEPLLMADGTVVVVTVEEEHVPSASAGERVAEFMALPFFGMWADREDMQGMDSVEWVKKMREEWWGRTKHHEATVR